MRLDQYSNPIFNEKELFDALYQGITLNTLLELTVDPTDGTRLFERTVGAKFNELDITGNPLELFDKANQCLWNMPVNYCPDLVDYLYSCCITSEQRDRVDQELTLYIQHSMFDLLFYLKYLVDTLREHNIIWGVGRGSSVASYVLYLIGVHKIDSIKYNLDVHEFLR